MLGVLGCFKRNLIAVAIRLDRRERAMERGKLLAQGFHKIVCNDTKPLFLLNQLPQTGGTERNFQQPYVLVDKIECILDRLRE